MKDQEKAVATIVGQVHDQIVRAIPNASRAPMTVDTLLSLAKELGFVVGRRGRGGGYAPTDEGLSFAGINVAEYRNIERQEQLKREAEASAAKAARQEAFAEILKGSVGGKAAH